MGPDDDRARPGSEFPVDPGLASSLAGLSRLAAHGSTLEDVLTRIAAFAVQAVPGAEGAGLTLLEVDRADTIVKSAPFVVQVDDIQYSLGEGPCIDAAAQGRVVRSGSLGEDGRWPRFGSRVSRLGVHSVLSLPLIAPAAVVGAINIYARPRDTFDATSEQIGLAFAGPAAISVQNAQILDQTRRLATALEAAARERAVIDQAIGVLRARDGLTVDQATEHLRDAAARDGRTVARTAADIVDRAVDRARDRTDPAH